MTVFLSLATYNLPPRSGERAQSPQNGGRNVSGLQISLFLSGASFCCCNCLTWSRLPAHTPRCWVLVTIPDPIVQAQVLWKALSTTISALSNLCIDRAGQLVKGGGAGSGRSSAREGSESPAAKQILQARNEEPSGELTALRQSHKELEAALHKAEQAQELLETENARLTKSLAALDDKFESGGQEARGGRKEGMLGLG